MTPTGGPADESVRRPAGEVDGLAGMFGKDADDLAPRESRVAALMADTRVRFGAGVVAALAAGLLAGGMLFGGDPAPSVAAPGGTPTVTAEPSSPAPSASSPPTTPVATVAQAPAPVGIAIPALGIDRSLIDLGVTEDRTLEVPSEWMDIGWWATGPAPGEAGGAVIAGHVNGDGKPAIFAELPTLEVGAEVDVTRADGSTASYVVRGKEQFAKDNFPNERIYTFEGPSYLHLVTCGGTFDPRSGHYDDNIVIFAELVGVTPA